MFRELWANRSGNFGMMLGFLSIPLIAGVGIATDYAQASRVKSLLSGAADAAATGAVSKASPTYMNGGEFSAQWTKAQAEEDALNLFRGYIAGKDGFELQALDATIGRQGTSINSTVEFSATVPMMFMRILGHDSVTINGKANAQVRTAPYIDFYMLLDNSPSMGVAATPAMIDRMVANTPDKCAFACHETSNAANYYNLAKTLGVTMRIDVVREATQNLFLKADETRVHHNQYRMGVYTFGESATAIGLQQLTTPTSNMAKARKAADDVDLMSIPHQGYDNDQQTNFDGTFAGLNNKIGAPGQGTGPDDREKIVFFVSDGVGDSYKPSTCTKPTTGGRCQEPIDIKACKALKDRGITVAVLYTTYLPLPTNGWYNKWVAPFQSEIATRMSSCATPGYFFEVRPGEGIAEAMEKLFIKIISSPRITS